MTYKRLLRSQKEMQTETPLWNYSSCKECDKTFTSKRKPRIPAEILLKLQKRRIFRLHVIRLAAPHTLTMIGQNVVWRTSFLIKTFVTKRAREKKKKKWRRLFGRSANSQTLGGIFCLKFGSAEENLRIFEKRDKF